MIDIKELNIGNKVKYKDSIVEIAATHLTSHVGILGAFQSMIVSVKCEEIEPIEVTDELLVTIGFKSLSSEPNEVKDFAFGMDEIDIIVNNYHNIYFCSLWRMRKELGCFDFKYLHELQNGIRLVTKKDLDTLEVML